MDKKEKIFITFGQVYVHSVNGKTFDKDCIAVIRCNSRHKGREIAWSYFGPNFCFSYFEDEFKENILKDFPRGLLEVEDRKYI